MASLRLLLAVWKERWALVHNLADDCIVRVKYRKGRSELPEETLQSDEEKHPALMLRLGQDFRSAGATATDQELSSQACRVFNDTGALATNTSERAPTPSIYAL